MDGYGVFLSTLRANAGLSLEILAKVVASSKSTLSRLENGEISRPFRGGTRSLIIQLAHILCSSTKETERYLALAGVDRSLLTEIEEIQLGFTPHIPKGMQEETRDLERLEKIYQQLLSRLEAWELELGVDDAPPNLKLKAQEYRNILQEIQKRLDQLFNRSDPLDLPVLEAAPAYYVETLGDRIVIGNEYASFLLIVKTSRGGSHMRLGQLCLPIRSRFQTILLRFSEKKLQPSRSITSMLLTIASYLPLQLLANLITSRLFLLRSGFMITSA